MFEKLFTDNLFYYYAFAPILSVLAFLLLLLLLFVIVIKKETKSNLFIVLFCVFLIFMSYQIIPWVLTRNALECNPKAPQVENLYKKAIAFSTFRAQKGMLYAELASTLALHQHRGEDGIKYFEISFKYFNKYYPTSYLVAPIIYSAKGDYDRAIEINDTVLNKKGLYTTGYILKDDFDKALNAANENILKYPDSSKNYIDRAIVYKNLNKHELAQRDYQKAIKLSRYKEEKQRNEYMFNNYKTYYKDTYHKLKNLYFSKI